MRPLPTWRYTLKMARYAPWLYLLHAGLWSVMNLLSLLPGLIAREFFDTLTGKAQMPGGISRATRAVDLACHRSRCPVAGSRFCRDHLPLHDEWFGAPQPAPAGPVLARRESAALFPSARPSAASVTMRTRPKTTWIGPTRSSARGCLPLPRS